MDRRLVGCGWAALLLHGSLVALGAVRPEARREEWVATAETDIDLLSITRDELPVSEPLPAPEVPAPIERSPAVATRLPKRAPRAEAPDETATGPESELAEAGQPAMSDVLEQHPAEPPATGKRLSLGDLGLTGTSSALLPPLQEGAAGRTDADVGGLKQALRARDTELGLGSGGAVAHQIRASAQDLAPLSSEATLSVDLASDGSIETIVLEASTSDEGEWRKVIRSVRERVGKQYVARGPMRVTLLVTSRSATRSGGSKSPFTFDVSNIGSPTMRWLHIRVLRQDPL